MPFYEYACKSCGHELEVMQKISDAPLRKCPACGKNQLQRLVSAPVFRLKGGGWYETDFKTDKDPKRNLATADAEKPAGKAEDRKDDAKPADAKPAAKPADDAPAKPKAKPASKRPAKRPARPVKRAAVRR